MTNMDFDSVGITFVISMRERNRTKKKKRYRRNYMPGREKEMQVIRLPLFSFIWSNNFDIKKEKQRKIR
jgi:hypothetical protein